MQNPNGQQSKLPSCNDYIRNITFMCRFIYSSLLIICLIDIFLKLKGVLSCSFESTIQNYYLWTLITSMFYQKFFFLILLFIINSSTFLSQLENKTGSVFFIIYLLMINFIIQIVVIALESMIFLIFSTKYQCQNGIIGLWLNLVYKYCYFNSITPIKLCCFSCKINKRVYPFILALIISLYSWEIRTDLLAGILISVLQCLLCSHQFSIRPPFKLIVKLEQLLFKCNVRKFQCWATTRQNLLVSNQDIFKGLEHHQHSLVYQTSPSDKKPQNHFNQLKGYKLNDL